MGSKAGKGWPVTPGPIGGSAGLTVRELADRYGVAPSTVGRAILRGARQGRPAPDPLYADRTGARHFHPAAFDRWWRDRPHRPRSHRRHPSGNGYARGRRRIVDVLPDLSAWPPAEPGPLVSRRGGSVVGSQP
jgi:hypothetical protein